jgi:hypothetical protein
MNRLGASGRNEGPNRTLTLVAVDRAPVSEMTCPFGGEIVSRVAELHGVRDVDCARRSRCMRHSRSRYATALLCHVSQRVRSSNFQHCAESLSIPL